VNEHNSLKKKKKANLQLWQKSSTNGGRAVRITPTAPNSAALQSIDLLIELDWTREQKNPLKSWCARLWRKKYFRGFFFKKKII
jgi:hypothetical protein